jgi:hypothetical protein
LFRKPCRDAVDDAVEPVDAAPLAPPTKLLNEEVRLAVVGLLLAPLDPNC